MNISACTAMITMMAAASGSRLRTLVVCGAAFMAAVAGSTRRAELVDQRLRLPDVGAAGRAKDDRFDLRLRADVGDRLARRDRARGEDRHRNRAEAPRRDRFLVGGDAAAHPKA